MSEHAEPAVRPRDAAQLLHAAADVLRQAGRQVPRGPWRWGDPDIGGDELGSGPVPRHERWPAPPDRRPNPLDESAPIGRRDPFGPTPSEWPPLGPGVHPHTWRMFDPEVAEPLAALLEVLAGHLERDETVDPQTRLTGLRLARALLRCYANPNPTTEEDLR